MLCGGVLWGVWVGFFGVMFKENVFDLWNFKFIDLIIELEIFGFYVMVNDVVVIVD